MRYMLDTCAVINMIMDKERLGRDVLAIVGDYDNRLLVSMESVREIIQKFKLGKLRNRNWKTADDILPSLEDVYGFEIVPVDRYAMRQYARLVINEAQDHRDPADHIIISHAIATRIPLISSDHKFAFYRRQGLRLCYYGRTPLD